MGTVSSESILLLKVSDGCRKVSLWNHDGFSHSHNLFLKHTQPLKYLKQAFSALPGYCLLWKHVAAQGQRWLPQGQRDGAAGRPVWGGEAWDSGPGRSDQWSAAGGPPTPVGLPPHWTTDSKTNKKENREVTFFLLFFKHTTKLQSTTWKPLKFLWRHTSIDHLF